ncbi:RdgB/HAM1 family non-canonical purine NTP pyrophosphatase [Salinibacterium sp. NK8237]|uniref:RdgB/HAM1 family non-canonical purine NTP pyrophosphatase n=1 Tax=Salinibacterium sp. NK8237 TaxID=2792038 RepID=UPI0018CF4C35|nr:RdgB/HAM1 family non-canonical purine NTP pyrophosphatase [Salinibacterium sp. NK8237]MBH0131356.1 RdgB/HAM1 family non-canonical purine NTP pyrophosphatase [Salinibacterium sp. NK8237]
MRIVLATHNAHKVAELRRILGPALDGLELVAYDGPEPVEDGETFQANALIKARAAAAHTGLPALADDSGICVDALGGAPGIHSARYAGTRNDVDNLELLLANMVGRDDRAAQFACAAAFVVPAGVAGTDGTAGAAGAAEAEAHEFVELALWPGTVATERSGTEGFGYDPIFCPDGQPGTSADLTSDQKDALSHRAQAFAAIMPIVRTQLLGD